MQTIEITDKAADMIEGIRSGKTYSDLHNYILNAISDTVEKVIDPQEAFLMMGDLNTTQVLITYKTLVEELNRKTDKKDIEDMFDAT